MLVVLNIHTPTKTQRLGGEYWDYYELYSMAAFIELEVVFFNIDNEYVTEALHKRNVSDSILIFISELQSNSVISTSLSEGLSRRRMCSFWTIAVEDLQKRLQRNRYSNYGYANNQAIP